MTLEFTSQARLYSQNIGFHILALDLEIGVELVAGGGARGLSLTGPARILFRAETQWDAARGMLSAAR